MLVSVDLTSGDKHSGEVRRTGTEVTALVLHPTNPSIYAFGTRDGTVSILRPIHNLNLQNAEVLFKSDTPIASLSFSPSGKLLLIATQHEAATLYCLNKKQMHQLPDPHEGYVNYVSFASEHVMYSLGSEGKLHLYGVDSDAKEGEEESEDIFGESTASLEIKLIDKYRFASESVSRKHHFMRGACAPWEGGVILLPGMNALQTVSLTQVGSGYQLIREIYSES